jgi:hypothetical protein
MPIKIKTSQKNLNILNMSRISSYLDLDRDQLFYYKLTECFNSSYRKFNFNLICQNQIFLDFQSFRVRSRIIIKRFFKWCHIMPADILAFFCVQHHCVLISVSFLLVRWQLKPASYLSRD